MSEDQAEPPLTWLYCIQECEWLAFWIGPHRHLLRDDGTMGIVVERLSDDAARRHIAAITHGEDGHRCSWACPQSSPLADIRAVNADIAAGLTNEQIAAKHSRQAPLFGIPYGAGEIGLDTAAPDFIISRGWRLRDWDSWPWHRYWLTRARWLFRRRR